MNRSSFPHLPAEAWELYLRDELSGPSLRSVETHLEDCAACSRALESADPSFLFRRLRSVAVRDEVLDGLWDEVRAEIEPAAAAGAARAPARTTRERLAVLAGAATLLLAALGLQLLPTGPGSPEAASFETEDCRRLALSSTECSDLFGEVRFDEEPPLFVESSANLSELL